jgi:hypothetical protein
MDILPPNVPQQNWYEISMCYWRLLIEHRVMWRRIKSLTTQNSFRSLYRAINVERNRLFMDWADGVRYSAEELGSFCSIKLCSVRFVKALKWLIGRSVTPRTHRVHVCPLMLGAVRTVAECFRAAGILAGVRPLPCVRSLVNLQVLKPGKRFCAPLKL